MRVLPQRARPAVDSITRPVQPSPALTEPPAEAAVDRLGVEVEAASPGLLARLGRALPAVDTLVRFAYRTAAASAVAAALVVGAVAEAVGGLPGWAVVLGLGLLLPSAGTALAGWTLADLVRIPGQLREAALAATGRSGAPAEGGRIVRLLKGLWAARGLALLTRGTWLKAVGALRFVRLASLPFALGLLALVALNVVVLAAGAVALLFLLF